MGIYVECSSNNVFRLLRSFPISLGVVSVMQLIKNVVRNCGQANFGPVYAS